MVKNMTEGSIPRHLITYAIPLILGNLFQLWTPSLWADSSERRLWRRWGRPAR